MVFTSKAFHNFKKTLKGELLVRGSREGKSLHIINGKHTKCIYTRCIYGEKYRFLIFLLADLSALPVLHLAR